MVAWVPVAKALRRYGPLVGPFLADKVRREAQPYWQAYQHARRIDGYIGAWDDESGKHWVVLDASRQEVIGAFPPMTKRQRELALEHLVPEVLQHHSETVVARLSETPARVRQSLPSRKPRSADDDR